MYFQRDSCVWIVLRSKLNFDDSEEWYYQKYENEQRVFNSELY